MSIKLKGSSDGSVSFDAPADTSPSGSDITLTLPTSAGSANQFLKNSGIAGELEYSSMVEDSSGNLRIDAGSADARLTIGSAGSVGSNDSNFIRAATDQVIYNASTSSGRHSFELAGSEKMRLDSSGNLGIGETSPLGKCHIKTGDSGASSVGASADEFVIEGSGHAGMTVISGTDQQCIINFADPDDVNVGGITYSHSNNSMGFRANDSERVRINDVGRFLIGRAISANPWEASGNVDAGQYFGAGNNFGAAFNSRNIPLILNRTNSTGTIQEFKYNASITGWITTTSSAISINYSSDYRLKENVIPLADAITRVKQLQPKRFNYIVDPDATVDGFLAHEAQTVVPEAVVGTHNQVDDNGDPVYQGIDPSKMVPLLTAALQEAIAKIETLETKVAALEAA